MRKATRLTRGRRVTRGSRVRSMRGRRALASSETRRSRSARSRPIRTRRLPTRTRILHWLPAAHRPRREVEIARPSLAARRMGRPPWVCLTPVCLGALCGTRRGSGVAVHGSTGPDRVRRYFAIGGRAPRAAIPEATHAIVVEPFGAARGSYWAGRKNHASSRLSAVHSPAWRTGLRLLGHPRRGRRVWQRLEPRWRRGPRPERHERPAERLRPSRQSK